MWNQLFEIQNTRMTKMNKVPLADLFQASLHCTYASFVYDNNLKAVWFLYVVLMTGHLFLVRLFIL